VDTFAPISGSTPHELHRPDRRPVAIPCVTGATVMLLPRKALDVGDTRSAAWADCWLRVVGVPQRVMDLLGQIHATSRPTRPVATGLQPRPRSLQHASARTAMTRTRRGGPPVRVCASASQQVDGYRIDYVGSAVRRNPTAAWLRVVGEHQHRHMDRLRDWARVAVIGLRDDTPITAVRMIEAAVAHLVGRPPRCVVLQPCHPNGGFSSLTCPPKRPDSSQHRSGSPEGTEAAYASVPGARFVARIQDPRQTPPWPPSR
jgi:hypothetical protein